MTLLRATALAALLFTTPALAQGQDHRHATPQPQASPPGRMMMTPDMMQGGMMQGGMMQGRGMGERRGAEGPMSLRGLDRVEGRLAFLKAELKITDAQLPAWNAFAEAVRGNATTMHVEQRAMHGQVGTGVSLPDRVLAQANAFTAHAEEMMRFKAVLDPLYASLSAEQKKTADEIVFSPMGVPIGMM